MRIRLPIFASQSPFRNDRDIILRHLVFGKGRCKPKVGHKPYMGAVSVNKERGLFDLLRNGQPKFARISLDSVRGRLAQVEKGSSKIFFIFW